jgi:hypothetical protein
MCQSGRKLEREARAENRDSSDLIHLKFLYFFAFLVPFCTFPLLCVLLRLSLSLS